MKNISFKLAGAFVAFAFAVAAVPASAITTDQVNAIVSMLSSFGVDAATVANIQATLTGQAPVAGGGSTPVTGGSSAACGPFTADLTMGSTSPQVVTLQTFLEEQGYLTIPAGVSKGYFGALTQSAVSAFQAAKGISPTAGYFGPVTRAEVAKYCGATTPSTGTPTTGTPSGDLQGGAGDIESVEFISGLNNEEVGEDEEDVEVAGWEIEASQGSDIAIRAITIDFDKTSSGSGSDDDFEDYAEEVSVWFNGDEVARVDADEFDDDNDYRRSITLDSGVVIEADDTEDLVVAVSGVRNLDSANEGETWNVSLNSIRFEDAQGAIITYSSGSDMEGTSDDDTTTDNDEREFSFESFSTAADIELKVSKGDDSINDSRVIKVDSNRDTDNVEIFSFELEAEGDSDIEIKDLPIFFTAAGTGAPTVMEIINSAELFIDGDSYGSENITINAVTGTTTFEDIDYVIDAGDTVEVVIAVDINDLDGTAFQEGNTLKAEFGSTQYNSSLFDAEDENGDNLDTTEKSGSASSEAHVFSETGVELSDVTSSVNRLTNDDTSGSVAWEFTLEAFDGDIDFNTATTTMNGSTGDVRFTVTGTDTSIGTTTLVLISGDATGDATGFVIEEGDDATFILETTFDTVDSADNGTYRVRLDSVAGVKVDKISGGLLLSN